MRQTRLLVLGSAAGGGFPQWNCNCQNCKAVRKGDPRYQARTQSSVAWSEDGSRWLLLNASPDILKQIQATESLQPRHAKRETGIEGVMLMDAQLDHVTGLIMLREHIGALPVYATEEVFSELSESFPLTKLLSHYCGVEQRLIRLSDGARPIFDPIILPWITDAYVSAFALQSKPPPYSAWRDNPRPGDNIGVTFVNESTGKRLVYAPGLGQIDQETSKRLKEADIVVVDGTFWHDAEMIEQGLGKKTARQMGHLPLSGPAGMFATLQSLPATTRKILIHINNTNPILREDSPERKSLMDAGIEVAHDGLEIWF